MTAAIEVAAIQISLYSSDPGLKKLLGEVLADIREPRCSLTVAEPEDTQVDADLCLWDYEPDKSLPLNAGFRASRHLFLVHTKNLAEFRALAPAEANILLKPATRDTLKATLGLAVSAHRERVSAATSLRAEHDDLLQCLIQISLHLQDYDNKRTAFLARAVHDFHAPLTAVNGYCGLFLGEHLGALNEMQKDVLQRMQHSARRLSRMARAMFELSAAANEKRSPNLLENDLRECLDRALHEILTFAEEKRITITTDLAPCDFPLYFEPGQMEQVLVNILDNACKFTPRAGMIEVSGYACFWERRSARLVTPPAVERRREELNVPNYYRVDIQDSGAPIPSEHLGRIFEEYTSYDGTGDRSGGGLGLAITRMLMARHEGHVWAENTAVGPRFSLVLPKRHSADDNSYHG